MTVTIEGTRFGALAIDGATYDHDVVIRLSGEIVKRKKKLSKTLHGTSHKLSGEEMAFVFEEGAELLVIGTGQYGRIELMDNAAAYLRERGCDVVLQKTPEALVTFNQAPGPKIGLFHVTC